MRMLSIGLDRHAIAVAGRPREDNECERFLRAVDDPMRHAGRDLQPLPGAALAHRPVVLHGRRTGEHVEKLTRAPMAMPRFVCARRHAFLDDREIVVLDQKPPVAPIAPDVVRGVADADRLEVIHTAELPTSTRQENLAMTIRADKKWRFLSGF
jgi:hypothetical protein